MAKKKEEPDYITHVSKVKIGGYKSIESVSIEFEKGLNILIGQNGTGKSNFFEALKYPLIFSQLDANIPKQWDITYHTLKDQNIRWEKFGHSIDEFKSQKQIDFNSIKFDQNVSSDNKIFIDSKNSKIKNLNQDSYYFVFVNTFWSLNNSYYFSNIIKYNLPESLGAFSKPLSYVIYGQRGSFIRSPDTINIIDNKLKVLFDPNNFIEPWIQGKISKIDLLKLLEFDKSLKRKIAQVTPIEDFRFNKNINIYSDDKQTTIENIYLEFKVHGQWMPWSWLSDGTKRLFYIVSEIASQEHGIILIEEPELGIHPHQFHLLMNFLKEESRDKQIIVSTHSPQALDYLDADELSHIIIADYDDKKGTQLRKLNAKEKKDALKFTKEVGYLSDYWLYADLEQRAE